MRSLIVILGSLALLVILAIQPASGADPSRVLGVPRPTVMPTCAAGIVGFYGSTADYCIYACTGTGRRLVAGQGCVIPTATATVTPTPTVTVTATP